MERTDIICNILILLLRGLARWVRLVVFEDLLLSFWPQHYQLQHGTQATEESL